MTLIELLWFVVCAFVAANAALWAYHRWGWLGGVGGFLVGFFITWVALYGVIWVLFLPVRIIHSGLPDRPTCRNRKCRSADYRLERLGKEQFAVRCKCGLLYRKQGRRFVELSPDGSPRPYMIWKAFRGWFPES